MKTITICAVLLAFGASYFFMTSTNSVASIEDQYQLYLAEYGKTVSNGEEFQTRLRIFADNLKAIEEMNSKQSSYKVAINKFADVIPKDNLGYTPSSAQSYHNYDGPLADSIDWREKGAVHPVKDQGSCRSGWAFSAAGAYEASYFIQRNTTLTKFSEQQLVDCAHRFGRYGCNGGYMAEAFDYLRTQDFCNATDYPYNGRDNRCTAHTCGVRGARVSRFYKVFSTSYRYLKAAINTGPVAVAIETSSRDFMLYKEGIIDTFDCGTKLDHGALAVGYGVENRTEYFLVKNSWGENWGQQGYVKIAANPRYEIYGGICGILLDATVLFVY